MGELSLAIFCGCVAIAFGLHGAAQSISSSMDYRTRTLEQEKDRRARLLQG